MYFERQLGNLTCAGHALNNIAGAPIFSSLLLDSAVEEVVNKRAAAAIAVG